MKLELTKGYQCTACNGCRVYNKLFLFSYLVWFVCFTCGMKTWVLMIPFVQRYAVLFRKDKRYRPEIHERGTDGGNQR